MGTNPTLHLLLPRLLELPVGEGTHIRAEERTVARVQVEGRLPEYHRHGRQAGETIPTPGISYF